ncbi:TfoX/Sxy family protein [Polaromonas sp.]|uniref:TfoX/Sxy family protein n=1 Tax=Polaromonas sp. TaxID=1869339 RepID=UPI003267A363
MAFDTFLAQRVRAALGPRPGITERQMFGGLAFLVHGKMFMGIRNSSLMARVGPEHHQDALAMPHVRVMDFTGRAMKGYVYIDPPAVAEDQDLKAWVVWCLEYVAGLPEKKKA